MLTWSWSRALATTCWPPPPGCGAAAPATSETWGPVRMDWIFFFLIESWLVIALPVTNQAFSLFFLFSAISRQKLGPETNFVLCALTEMNSVSTLLFQKKRKKRTHFGGLSLAVQRRHYSGVLEQRGVVVVPGRWLVFAGAVCRFFGMAEARID